MIRKLTTSLLIALTLAAPTLAQFGMPPNADVLVRLRDDVETSHIIIVREDNSYLVSVPENGDLRIESVADKVIRFGDMMVISEETDWYSLFATFDINSRTGRVYVKYFLTGEQLIIVDDTVN